MIQNVRARLDRAHSFAVREGWEYFEKPIDDKSVEIHITKFPLFLPQKGTHEFLLERLFMQNNLGVFRPPETFITHPKVFSAHNLPLK